MTGRRVLIGTEVGVVVGCGCGVRRLGSWYVTLHVPDPATGLYDYVERFACSVRHRDAFIAAHRDDPAVELIEFERVEVL